MISGLRTISALALGILSATGWYYLINEGPSFESINAANSTGPLSVDEQQREFLRPHGPSISSAAFKDGPDRRSLHENTIASHGGIIEQVTGYFHAPMAAAGHSEGPRPRETTSTPRIAGMDGGAPLVSSKDLTPEGVVVIHSQNYRLLKSYSTWLVLVYLSKSCPHSKAFEPIWKELALRLGNKAVKNVRIAQVDASRDPAVAALLEARAYPSIKLVSDGRIFNYPYHVQIADELLVFLNGDLREADFTMLADQPPWWYTFELWVFHALYYVKMDGQRKAVEWLGSHRKSFYATASAILLLAIIATRLLRMAMKRIDLISERRRHSARRAPRQL